MKKALALAALLGLMASPVFAADIAKDPNVTIEVFDIMRIDGGKIVEHWGQTDIMGMMQQLDAMPGPE